MGSRNLKPKNQEQPSVTLSEDNFNLSDNSFSFTQDGVTVTKSVVPSLLSLKKAMAYKQALRTAVDSRLRMELEDFNIPKKACAKDPSSCKVGGLLTQIILLPKQGTNFLMRCMRRSWTSPPKLRPQNTVFCKLKKENKLLSMCLNVS